MNVYNEPWYLRVVCPEYRVFLDGNNRFPYYINDRIEAASPYGYPGIFWDPSNGEAGSFLARCRSVLGVPLFIRHCVDYEPEDKEGISSHATRIIPCGDSWQEGCDFLKEARRAERLGIKAEIRGSEKKALEEFRDGYRDAMQRKGSADKYCTLVDCIHQWSGNRQVVLCSGIQCGALFLVGDDGWAHYHLSWRGEGAPGPAMYAIFATVVPHLAKLGIKQIHLGGGMTNSPDDPLYKFKSKVGRIPHTCYFQEVP